MHHTTNSILRYRDVSFSFFAHLYHLADDHQNYFVADYQSNSDFCLYSCPFEYLLRVSEFLTEFYLSRRFARKGFDKGRVVRGTGVRVEGRVDWWNIRRCVGQELSIMEVWLCAFKKGFGSGQTWWKSCW